MFEPLKADLAPAAQRFYERTSNENVVIEKVFGDPYCVLTFRCKVCGGTEEADEWGSLQVAIDPELTEFCKNHRHEAAPVPVKSVITTVELPVGRKFKSD